jgi:hypothetical protein
MAASALTQQAQTHPSDTDYDPIRICIDYGSKEAKAAHQYVPAGQSVLDCRTDMFPLDEKNRDPLEQKMVYANGGVLCGRRVVDKWAANNLTKRHRTVKSSQVKMVKACLLPGHEGSTDAQRAWDALRAPYGDQGIIQAVLAK